MYMCGSISAYVDVKDSSIIKDREGIVSLK
jgi:hypothetical protein